MDGRPEEIPEGWYIDAAIAAGLIAQAAARLNPYVIDYEHQTLNAAQNGQPAPAAGWFGKLEWRDSGLWAIDVEWTDITREMIAKRQYKYFSPVFRYDTKTGAVTALLMGAVTNFPAIHGMAALAARADLSFNSPEQETHDMKALLLLLGLKEDATEAEALAALQALIAGKKQAEEAVAAAKSAAENPDPKRFVPVGIVQDLQTQVAQLTEAVNSTAVDKVITDAIREGRLLPAMEGWARDLGKRDLAALKSYIAAAQPIAALSGTQSGGRDRAAEGDELSEHELAVCRSMGLSPEEYKKNRPATS